MRETVEITRLGCGVSRVLDGAGVNQHFLAVGVGPIEPFYASETILNSTLFSGMQECITRYREVEE